QAEAVGRAARGPGGERGGLEEGGLRLPRPVVGHVIGEDRLGAAPEVVRRFDRLDLPGPLADRGGLHPLVAERVGLPITVFLELRRAALHLLPQAAGAVRVISGEGGQTLPLLVRLLLVL